MTVAVTGAAGFIGGHLCRRIVELGGDAIALARKRPARNGRTGVGVRWVDVDLPHDASRLTSVVAGADIVVHLAGTLRARTRAEFHHGNVAVTRAVVEVLADTPSPPRLVVCSSLAAGGPAPAPGVARTEEHPPAPVSWYGHSKLAAERVARDFCGRVPVVLVRPSIVYGPNDRAFVPWLVSAVRSGVALQPAGRTGLYAPLHVDDLCDGLLAAAVRGVPAVPRSNDSGLYHLAEGRHYTLAELTGCAAAAMGRRAPKVLPVPGPLVQLAGWVAEGASQPFGHLPTFNRDKAREACLSWTSSPERARRDLQFHPHVSFEDGMRALFQ
ncbi:NAD(P)-dependent oxidoreductase [Streptomyces sp. NPDC051183]|uniref:NAD-dependent epimerase/dehydratase family protein n=1 Tax=unclassified Streptomyces TaxID=2593676 RepID=UPI0034396903